MGSLIRRRQTLGGNRALRGFYAGVFDTGIGHQQRDLQWRKRIEKYRVVQRHPVPRYNQQIIAKPLLREQLKHTKRTLFDDRQKRVRCSIEYLNRCSMRNEKLVTHEAIYGLFV
ncbi:MAG: hypothetical protein AAFN74_17730 [Myxococcota bacterium]